MIPVYRYELNEEGIEVNFIEGLAEIDCAEISSETSSYPTIDNIANSVDCMRTTGTFFKIKTFVTRSD